MIKIAQAGYDYFPATGVGPLVGFKTLYGAVAGWNSRSVANDTRGFFKK